VLIDGRLPGPRDAALHQEIGDIAPRVVESLGADVRMGGLIVAGHDHDGPVRETAGRRRSRDGERRQSADESTKHAT
jgi:hypothetical protein